MEPRLEIKHWYQVLVYLGIAGMIASMTIELHGIENAHAILLFLGMLLFGLGQWINHPLQTSVVAPNRYLPGGGTITGHPRSAKPLGIVFEIAGMALTGFAVYQVIANA